MMVKQSVIYESSFVENQNPHMLANSDYYLVYVEAYNGEFWPALFTRHEVAMAISRADRNPEDTPSFKKSITRRVLQFLRII